MIIPAVSVSTRGHRWLRAAVVLLSAVVLFGVTPARAAGADPNAGQYLVGAGDILTVAILPGTGAEPSILDLQVAGDGTISVIYVGTVKVAGLSSQAIGGSVQRLLVSRDVFKQPHVSVNVKEHLSQGVNVAGFVNAPGRFFLKGPTRLLDVISLAGGVNELEAGDVIQVMRQGAAAPLAISRTDLVGGDLHRSDAANIFLQANDTIHVPKAARFCIVGPVRNPNCYAVTAGMTLLQAISVAGGLDETQVNRAKVTIRRMVDGKASETQVSLEDVEGGQSVPLVLADDQVVVAAVTKTPFCALGPVMKPDCYAFEGMLTLEEAIAKAGGLDVLRAQRSNIVVRRVVSGSLKEFTLDLDRSGAEGARFPILKDDQIIVGETKHQVTVDGEVKSPGQFDLTPGLTLSEAIAKAGGGHSDTVLGALSKVILRRGTTVTEHDVKAIQRGKATDVLLESGDKIFVPRRKW